MIKVIGFDFGDVLMRDTVKGMERKYWPKASKLSRENFLHALHKVDTGNATEEYLITALREYLAVHLSETQVRKIVFSSRVLPPWKLLQKVLPSYKVAILTNNYKNGPETFSRLLKMDIRECQIINSSRLGVRKPHKDFYRLALKKLKIKPEELLFIDDVSANVSTARKLGIKAFRYNANMPELKAFMKKQGIAL